MRNMSLINLLRKQNRKTLFTTPSHGQHFFIFNKLRNFYKYDISETDAHNPQKALLQAEDRASNIYGVKHTHFLTNGSTSGVIASVSTGTQKGDRVLIWRNAHPSHLNAVRLAGCEPIYYDLPIIKEWGIPDKTTPEILKKSADDLKDIKAVIVTSPSYEGIVSDKEELKDFCKDTYLIVDEAHGALYPFSDKLPQSAVKIADFTIQSLHKTAGGLNPTALLHVNCNLDATNALSMINTTSPSYPLLATIEANINYLNSKKGRKKLDELIENMATNGYQSLDSNKQNEVLLSLAGRDGGIAEELKKRKIAEAKANGVAIDESNVEITVDDINIDKNADLRDKLVAQASELSYHELNASVNGTGLAATYKNINEEIERDRLVNDVLRSGVSVDQVRYEIEKNNPVEAQSEIAETYASKVDVLTDNEKAEIRENHYKEKFLEEQFYLTTGKDASEDAENFEEFKQKNAGKIDEDQYATFKEEMSADEAESAVFVDEVNELVSQKNMERIANGATLKTELTAAKVRENSKLMERARMLYSKTYQGADLDSASEIEQREFLAKNFGGKLALEDQKEIDETYIKARIENAPTGTKLADTNFKNARNLAAYARNSGKSIDQVLEENNLVNIEKNNVKANIVKNLSSDEFNTVYSELTSGGDTDSIAEVKKNFARHDIEAFEAESGLKEDEIPNESGNITKENEAFINELLQTNDVRGKNGNVVTWNDLGPAQRKILLKAGEGKEYETAANIDRIQSTVLANNIDNLKSSIDGGRNLAGSQARIVERKMFGTEENKLKVDAMLDQNVVDQEKIKTFYAKTTKKDEFDTLTNEEKIKFVEKNYDKILEATDEFGDKLVSKDEVKAINGYINSNSNSANAAIVGEVDAALGNANFAKKAKDLYQKTHKGEKFDANSVEAKAFVSDNFDKIKDSLDASDRFEINKAYVANRLGIKDINSAEGRESFAKLGLKDRNGNDITDINTFVQTANLEDKSMDVALTEISSGSAEGKKLISSIKKDNTEKDLLKQKHLEVSNNTITQEIKDDNKTLAKQVAIIKDANGNVVLDENGKARTMNVKAKYLNADGSVTIDSNGRIAKKNKLAARDEFGNVKFDESGNVVLTDKKAKKAKFKSTIEVSKVKNTTRKETDVEIESRILSQINGVDKKAREIWDRTSDITDVNERNVAWQKLVNNSEKYNKFIQENRTEIVQEGISTLDRNRFNTEVAKQIYLRDRKQLTNAEINRDVLLSYEGTKNAVAMRWAVEAGREASEFDSISEQEKTKFFEDNQNFVSDLISKHKLQGEIRERKIARQKGIDTDAEINAKVVLGNERAAQNLKTFWAEQTGRKEKV